MAKVAKALVVGSGVAGPATAMALQKAGIEAELYEAHPHDAAGVGSFLTLASNGVDALRVLGAGQVLATAFSTPYTELRSSTGKVLGRAPTGIELPDGTTSQTVTRSDLYRGMHDEAARRGIEVRYGRRLVEVDEDASGVRARFADGSTAAGDVVVGCDGVHSTVRRLIDPDAPAPAYSGLLTTGGYARGVPVDVEPGSYQMIFGRRAFFGYAAAPDGSVWWFANVPRADEPERGEPVRSGDELGPYLRDLFLADAGPAAALVDATRDPAPLSPVHTLARLPNWHRGRCVVIGDAAHAPSPTSGQGASLSIEDALVLAKCLRDLPDHRQAFASYVRQRRPRVERIVRAAARINNAKVAGPVAASVRDLVMPLVMRLTAGSAAATHQFRYHVDWTAPTEHQPA